MQQERSLVLHGLTFTDGNKWKTKLRNVNSSRKAFREPVEGSFHELEQCVFEYVCEKHKDGFPITWDVIRMKALELFCQIQYPEILTSSKSVPDGALAWDRLYWLCSHIQLSHKDFPHDVTLQMKDARVSDLSLPGKGNDDQRAHDWLNQACLEPKARLPSQQVWDACSSKDTLHKLKEKLEWQTLTSSWYLVVWCHNCKC